MYQPVDGPIVYSNINVSTTAVELKVGATPSAERKVIIVQSLGNRIYIGFDSGVTTSNGIELSKRQTLFLEVSENANIWAIASSGTIDVRIAELG
jgi:hypothetical protein